MIVDINSKREYVLERFSNGFPAEANIYYECMVCGAVLPSIPNSCIKCKCGNISIDIDYGRVSVIEQEKIKVFRLKI